MAKVVKLSIRQLSSDTYEVELLEIRADDRAEPLAENISGFLSAARLYNNDLANSGFSIEQHYRGWQERYKGLDGYFKGDPTQTKGFPPELEVQECDLNAEELKIWLNEWLQDPAFRRIADRLRMELSKEDEIRFLIKAEGEVLRNLPWADWEVFQYYDKAEVALTNSEFRGDDRPTASKPKKKPGILAICGDKAGSYQYNPANIDKLRSVGAQPEFLNEPNSKQVRDRFWDKNLDILFFAGRSGDRLHFNGTDKTKLSHLDNALKAAAENGLKLAIFNCADGLQLADLMISKHQIPMVIAMKEPVPNEFAQEFFEYFLLEYAFKKQPLYVAFRKARQRVSDDWQGRLPGIQWLPIIWQNPAKRPPLWQDLREAVSLPQVSLAGVACTGLVMLARLTGLLQPLELAVFDRVIRWRPPAEPDDRLLVVEVTEKDIKKYEYPLSDATVLKLLRVLRRYKPLAIGLDLQRDKPVEPGSAELRKYLSQSQSEGPGESQRLFVSCQVGSPKRANSSSPPPANVAEKQIGFRDFVPDRDGIVRRHLFSISASDGPCKTSNSLSTQLALRYLEGKDYRLKETSAGLQLGKATLQRLKNYSGFYQQLNDDRGQQLLLNYRSYDRVADEVSLSEVLNNGIQSDKIKDRIVLVGMTAPSAALTLGTPYGSGRDREMPEVLLQAQMTSQIISAAQGDRPLLGFWPFWGDLFWVAAWSVAGGLVVVYCREPLSQKLAGTAALVGLSGICFAVFATSGIYLPLVPSALVLVGTATIGVFLSSNRSAIERWLPKGLKLPAINRRTGSISFKLPS